MWIMNNELLVHNTLHSGTYLYTSLLTQCYHVAHRLPWYFPPSRKDGWLHRGLNLMLKICWPLEVRPSIEMPHLIYIHWHGMALSAKQMLQHRPCIRFYISSEIEPLNKVRFTYSLFLFSLFFCLIFDIFLCFQQAFSIFHVNNNPNIMSAFSLWSKTLEIAQYPVFFIERFTFLSWYETRKLREKWGP